MKNKRLSQKQANFVQNIVELGIKEAVKCAELAGYVKNPEKWAEKLLKNIQIKTKIAKEIKETKEPANIGRPRMFKTVEDLQEKVEDYFNTENIITITGLALHLGFTSRQALMNYQHRDEFVDTIKKAKLKVELEYEKRLIENGRGGDVFALKNFGWTDKQEIESTNTNLNIDKQIDENATPQEASRVYQEFMKNRK